ncbi:MAG: 3-oxoacyl-[acyl-carrier-protein] reductase [Candidatus Omnitrophica bacterium]|nr:3-oxoacyl-[acyl-carrier-protein] reductase [Candidatus Omnitrophota bacterium]
MKLQDKIAVITGGTRGIGKAIVEAFAREGAQVLFTYLQNETLAKEIEINLKKKQAEAKGFKVDVKNYSQVDQWKEKILDEYGKVDILINNAGIIKDKALAMMSKEEWDDVIDTNLNGLFHVTKSFIVTFLKQRHGNIINISSLSGIIGIPRQTNYSASKGAMISFSKALAKEVAPYNVRVNVVAPGFIHTDMTKDLKKDYIKHVMPQIPLNRFGTVDEVARVALFLATEQSNYITGQVVQVDGGLGM